MFFVSRGHTVHRVSSQKAADLRRFLSRHIKTNGIDADTLARLPLIDPGGLRPLELPSAEAAALDRRVRATDRLTRVAAEHKRRIKDLVRQLMPMTPLTGDLGVADLTVLEHDADPNVLVTAGVERLTAVIVEASNNHQGAERAHRWVAAAEAAIEFYAGHPAVAFADLAAEVATEVRLLRAAQAELAAHAAERERCYRFVDPGALARSLPGFAEVGGPALVACMGDPARFRRGKQFRAFTGLAPKASGTGETDRKGQAMSRAGSSLLRTTLVRAADTARSKTPARPRLLHPDGRAGQGPPRRPLRRRRQTRRTSVGRPEPPDAPYVICDADGRPVRPEEAKAIIAEHWTVPPEVRARRRSKKTGKAPQKVLMGHSKPDARGVGTRGDLPQPPSSPARRRSVKQLAGTRS